VPALIGVEASGNREVVRGGGGRSGACGADWGGEWPTFTGQKPWVATEVLALRVSYPREMRGPEGICLRVSGRRRARVRCSGDPIAPIFGERDPASDLLSFFAA
jgi:hypothetical protein